ncbi:MAG: helix-hairpin-helix domain-containing protein [Saprospiraceae bacterium]
MATNLKDYAYFTKAQIKGIFILSSLLLLGFVTPTIISKLASKKTTDFSEFEKEITEFEEVLKNEETPFLKKEPINPAANAILFDFDPNVISKEKLMDLGLTLSVANTFVNFRNKGFKFYKKEDVKRVYGLKETDYQRLAPYIKIAKRKPSSFPKKPNKSKKQKDKKSLTPFKFNPNEADKTTLLSLGLSNKIVQTILNYRNSGAQFKYKEDFKKIYGLSERDYLTLAPFIEIPEMVNPIATKTVNLRTIPQGFNEVTAIKVDINKSSVEDWKQLKGIGEITAKRIVNYRGKLGGFVSIDQLKTTYNIADSVIDKVAHQLIISPILNKIPINTISAETLLLHPYIKKKQAYLIVNYRTNHGRYNQLKDLEKVKALTPDFIKRIAPYLSFE